MPPVPLQEFIFGTWVGMKVTHIEPWLRNLLLFAGSKHLHITDIRNAISGLFISKPLRTGARSAQNNGQNTVGTAVYTAFFVRL